MNMNMSGVFYIWPWPSQGDIQLFSGDMFVAVSSDDAAKGEVNNLTQSMSKHNYTIASRP
jgi:hypothetical protein